MNNLKTRRRFLWDASILAGALMGLPTLNLSAARGIPRIGYFAGAGFPQLESAFIDELSKLGYTEGQNIHIEKRFSRPNTSDSKTMAMELASMELALIVVAALPLALEVRKANAARPMVIATCPGMVSNGFAQSLGKPGGIYTGMDELPEGVTSKRLQLLKTTAPGITSVALLSTTPGQGGHETQLSEAKKIAATFKIEVRPYRATTRTELEEALNRIAADGMKGLLSFQGGLALVNRQLIVDFAVQHRIPAVYQATLFAEAGGLMAWAPDLIQQFRETARFVDKILDGTKPGDLPIKHPDRYYLTINKSAAERIGLVFPKEVLEQADKILS